MKKRLLFSALVSIMFFPFCVKALDLDSSVISFTCDKNTIAPNEQATCILKASLGETSASGFSTDVTLTDNLVFVSFEKNSFFDAGGSAEQINNTNAYAITMNNSDGDGKSGNFDIGTLVVKASPDATDVATISFQNTKFAVETTDSTVDGNVALASKDLTISLNTNNGADNGNTTTDNNNTNTDTNTNDNTNVNDATSDASETKKENPKNPDTGVTLSALGIALLVVGGISYIALRKKNYFNRI